MFVLRFNGRLRDDWPLERPKVVLTRLYAVSMRRALLASFGAGDAGKFKTAGGSLAR